VRSSSPNNALKLTAAAWALFPIQDFTMVAAAAYGERYRSCGPFLSGIDARLVRS